MPRLLPWVAVVLLAASCGGAADDAAPPTTTAAAGTTTSAPGTTAPTTTSEAPATTTTVAATTSTTTTTTVAPADLPDPVGGVSVDDLIAALPRLDDLPAGWDDVGNEPLLELPARSGPGWGFCGGKNSSARALDAGVESSVIFDGLVSPAEEAVGVAMHAFPDDAAAQSYMDATLAALNSCETVEYEAPERVDGQPEPEDAWFDGFIGDFDPGRLWDVTEQVSAGPPVTGVDADDAVQAQLDSTFITIADGVKYRDVYRNLAMYERYGNVVLIIQSYTGCCLLGYAGVEPTTEEVLSTFPDLAAVADVLRPIVLGRLAG